MDETEGAVSLTLYACGVEEIPARLLQQKKLFDLDAARATYAGLGKDCRGFVLYELGRDIALAVFVVNRLYRSLWLDTLVIDKEVRSDDTVRRVIRLMHEVAVELARSEGLLKVSWASKFPDRHREMLSGLAEVRDVETVQSIEVT